ncbi:MAG TPA: T9SS type A sorting domain-containing protein [Bacteroidales bacterium]|nr:T9SS type A sorting domain-containing protein [Bacteroidales bacterium]HRX95318.1 T9SS type A sorting domain-containing protein [Bacteroidales bacterium]
MIYNKILFTLALALSYQFVSSQVWPKYYNQVNSDAFVDDIVEVYDQGYLICGNYNTYSGGEFKQWSWLIKTDVNGEVLWDKVIEGGDENMRSIAMELTEDGGILLCGFVWSEIGASDPYVMKLNTCGEKEWCNIFASSTQSNPWAQDIIETQTGDIVVLINQYGEDNEEDMDIFKLDELGNLLWKKTYCSGNIHPEAYLPIGVSFMLTSQNNYLVSGEVYWNDPWNPGGLQPIRPMFVLVDSSGVEKWVLPFGLNDTIIGTAKMAIEPKANGEFIATGSDWRTDKIKPFFMKFDQEGNELDYHSENPKNFCTEIFEGAFIQIINHEEKYFLSGISELEPGEIFALFKASIDTGIFSMPLQIYDSALFSDEQAPHDIIFSNNSKLMNSSTLHGIGNWDIVLSKLNLNLEYDTLDPGTYTYDSLCTTPGLPQSGFIFLDDCDIITGVDIPSPEKYYASLNVIPITVFPNPAKDKVTFGLENTEHHKNILLKCFNLLGKQAFETTILTGQKEAATDVNRWPQGMYVAVVYSEGLPVGECKFVVQ